MMIISMGDCTDWCPCAYGQSVMLGGNRVAENKAIRKGVDRSFEACSMKRRFSTLSVNCVQLKVFIFLVGGFQLVGL